MKKIYHQKKSSYPIRTRHALSLLILLFLCVSAHSQAFYGGIAAGAVTSQVDGDENNGFHKAGFTAGAFVGLELSDIFELQFEIKYIQKGSKSSTDDQMDFSIKLDYIEVPLVVSANLGFFNINGKKFDWISFETGLSLDVLARVRQTYNGVNEPVSSQWKSMCFNGILGLKFNLTEKLQLGTRVITSINSAYNGNKYRAWRFGQWGAFNDVFELVLYYRFK
ncbi:MAG: outer membrane beta-barrel protein [Bacteroidales bacterium]|nr:outer membrane beta-barrel protein [Bacteroidales bacterium]